MSDTDPVADPAEPVFRWTLIVPVLMAIETATVGLIVAFTSWRPTAEQYAALAAVQTPLLLVVGFLTAWQARQQVMPVEKAEALIAVARAEPPPDGVPTAAVWR